MVTRAPRLQQSRIPFTHERSPLPCGATGECEFLANALDLALDQPRDEGRRPVDDPRAGNVLLLALLALTAVVLVGVTVLEVSANRVSNQDLDLRRLRAAALAEGAVEVAYQTLLDAPDTRGVIGVNHDAAGTWGARVAAVSGEVEVTGAALVEGTRHDVLTRARLERTPDAAFSVAGASSFTDASFTWTGTYRHVGAPGRARSTLAGGRVQVPSASRPAIDVAALLGEATQSTEAAETTWSDGTVVTGITVVRGDLRLRGRIEVQGILAVDGSVLILGDDVDLTSPGGRGVVLITGDVSAKDAASLRLNGSFIVEGSLAFENLTTVVGGGVVILGTDLVLTDVASMTWTFPASPRPLPVYVTGLQSTGTVSIHEVWRRPTTASVPLLAEPAVEPANQANAQTQTRAR
ncbi:MAG: hypothetical protein AB7O52_02995 [Planctomycetota bacterium]